MILVNVLIYIGFDFFFISKVFLPDTYYLETLFLNSNKSITSFLFCMSLLFLLGYFDDKYDLDPFKKLLVLFLIFYIFFQLDNTLVISKLNLTFVSYSIEISEVGFLFSLFLSLLFLNSINMYDGINGQVGLLSFNVFLYFLLNNFMSMFALLLVISLVSFLILNLKGKIFMGDSGCYIISFILTYFFLRYYNLGLIKLDQVFLIFFLPIVDALRVFVSRIFSSGQPWKADRNHLHHLIMKKFNLNIALISQYIFSLFLLLLVSYTNLNNLVLIFFLCLIYFTSLIKLKRNKI